MVKGELTRYIKFSSESEMNELISYIIGNYKEEAFTILLKMIDEKRFVF